MTLSNEEIKKIIPHRYPFLLVDKIESIDEENQTVVGIKCVSANEMQFLGHFPELSVMPGVLIVEAMAQTGAVLLLKEEANKGKIPLFAGINKMRFARPVVPGDVLKMQVPAIIFRADNADFKGINEAPKNGLTQEQIDNNMRVLKRIAEILNKFKGYSVSIEGHANNISGTEAEETSTANGNIPLVPLSEARAETVKGILVDFGVDASRLSTVGMGGRMPVVPRSDKDNWWKNRRVEFILEK